MTTTAAPPSHAGNESFGSWAKGHNTELYVGLAALGLTVYLYLRSKKSSSTTTTPSGTIAPASTITYLPATTGAGTTGSTSSSWSGAGYPGILPPPGGTAAKGGGTGAVTTSTTPAAKKKTPGATVPVEQWTQEVVSGQGYSAGATFASGSVRGSTGGTFSTIASYTATLALLGSGGQVFYEPSLGKFTPLSSVTQFKALEHTKSGPQTTTWTKVP